MSSSIPSNTKSGYILSNGRPKVGDTTLAGAEAGRAAAAALAALRGGNTPPIYSFSSSFVPVPLTRGSLDLAAAGAGPASFSYLGPVHAARDAKLSLAITNFSQRFLAAHLNRSDSSRSFAFAPFCMYTCLGLGLSAVEEGAKNDYINALGLTGDELSAHRSIASMGKHMSIASADEIITVANAIATDNPHVLEALKPVLQDIYGAATLRADQAEVNGWVARETQGKITQFPLGGSPVTLLSAFYLNLKWRHSFKEEPTPSLPFTLVTGEVISLPFMEVEATLNVSETEDYTLVELPYNSSKGHYSQLIFMPKSPESLRSLESSLNHEYIQTALSHCGTKKVKLRMPESKLDCNISATRPLREIGIPLSAFRSDLLPAVEVQQIVTFENNPKGTIAAAVTVMRTRGISLPPDTTITLDRPHICLVVKTEADEENHPVITTLAVAGVYNRDALPKAS